jgi:taurine--2-oxoglutarate transaminase
MICDEVMCGFGRCGEWFAVDHWNVTPDLICFAKGVNSGYVPLGGVIISDRIADSFRERQFPGGLTYSGHPLACASAIASINIYKEEGILDKARRLGTDVIAPGLELVRNRETREPLVPFNAAGPDAKPMMDVLGACKAQGLWPFTHFNRIHVTPPLTTSDAEIHEGLAIIDEALTLADALYTGK